MGSLLYRLCARFLAALPVDATDRRVFDETLADWRREGRPARGLLAVLRGVILVAVREVRSATMRSFAVRVGGWSVAWVLARLALGRWVGGGEAAAPATLALWSVVLMAFFLPVAILLASTDRRSANATLGAALAAAALAIVLMGWALPATSRAIFPGIVSPESWTQRVLAPAGGARGTFRDLLPALPMEMIGNQSAPQLVAHVVSGPPNGWGAIDQLSFRAAFVVMCVLMPFAGSALRARPRVWRYLGVAALVLLVLYQRPIEALFAADWILWMFVSCWVPVALLGLGLVASMRGTDVPEPAA